MRALLNSLIGSDVEDDEYELIATDVGDEVGHADLEESEESDNGSDDEKINREDYDEMDCESDTEDDEEDRVIVMDVGDEVDDADLEDSEMSTH
jgi:hypothetical protein